MIALLIALGIYAMAIATAIAVVRRKNRRS